MSKRNQKPRSALLVRDLYEEFLNQTKVYKKSPATIRGYTASRKMLYDIFPGIENESIVKLDKQFTITYTSALNKKSMTAASINHYLRDLRVFLYWCMENYYLVEYKVKLVREIETLKESYTKEELAVLLRPPRKKDLFVEWRTWAMITWMLSFGSRASTIIEVRQEDVDLDANIILTRHNKNGRIKSFPITPELRRALTEYCRHLPDRDCVYLFPNNIGEKLTYNAFRLAVTDYNRNRGVMKTSIHLFRHTFGKMWAESGGNVYELQTIFGHSDIRTTQRYINLYGVQQDQNRMIKLSPLETMAKEKNK